MKSLLNILASIALLASLAKGVLAGDIMVMNAAAPESLTPAAKTAALYLSIMNHGAGDDALVSVTTPAADHAAVHETTMENDLMKMAEVKRLVIPAGSTVDLKPAATHVMLTGLKAPLKEGETVSLTLTFEKAGEMKIDAPIVDFKSIPAAEHDHMGSSEN
jgi:copper(I)-binding protein